MHNEQQLRRGRHCVSALHAHLVFVTKYRGKVFDGDAIERLRVMFAKVCEDFGAQLVEMDGEADHAHLLVQYPPVHRAVSNANLRPRPQSHQLARPQA